MSSLVVYTFEEAQSRRRMTRALVCQLKTYENTLPRCSGDRLCRDRTRHISRGGNSNLAQSRAMMSSKPATDERSESIKERNVIDTEKLFPLSRTSILMMAHEDVIVAQMNIYDSPASSIPS